ncbi:MAG TPA: hypothetical protein VK960_08380 [Acidimicrobiia bacterium]|nr:hypothetical protein [Acidimicrobiia bacterium]
MTDGGRRQGIEIPEEVARSEGVPDDLDATQREPYSIPSTRRRNVAAAIYAVGAVVAGTGAVFAYTGLAFVAGLLALLALWHRAAAWRIEVLDPQALEIANREVPLAVGHASAAVGFDGWRARPIWNVLVFSADEPPSQRGLIRVDAVDGKVVGTYVEQIPSPRRT